MNAIFFCAIIGLVLPAGNLAATFADIAKQLRLPMLNTNVRNQFAFPKDATHNIWTRIIGGTEVSPHSYPFEAALLIYVGSDIYFCGGTLIKPQWVLTAAHCLAVNPDYVYVVLGAHDLDNLDSTENVQNATHFVVHEGWNEDLLVNDVGLIKLPNAVTLTKTIATVKFAEGNDTYANETGTILGWGQTETSITISPVLRSVNSSVMSNVECAKFEPLDGILQDSHVCVSGAGIVGGCAGDSGGPLLVDGVQVGIISFGFSDCLLGKPSVSTRITEFHDWIDQHSGAES